MPHMMIQLTILEYSVFLFSLTYFVYFPSELYDRININVKIIVDLPEQSHLCCQLRQIFVYVMKLKEYTSIYRQNLKS